MPYKVDPKTGLIDYDTLEKVAETYRPKVIVAGVYYALYAIKRVSETRDSIRFACTNCLKENLSLMPAFQGPEFRSGVAYFRMANGLF